MRGARALQGARMRGGRRLKYSTWSERGGERCRGKLVGEGVSLGSRGGVVVDCPVKKNRQARAVLQKINPGKFAEPCLVNIIHTFDFTVCANHSYKLRPLRTKLNLPILVLCEHQQLLHPLKRCSKALDPAELVATADYKQDVSPLHLLYMNCRTDCWF